MQMGWDSQGDVMKNRNDKTENTTRNKTLYTSPHLKIYGDVINLTKGCDEELVSDSQGKTGTGTPGTCTSSP